MSNARWYRFSRTDWLRDNVPMQQTGDTLIPKEIAKLAHEEYSRHHSQSFARLHQRGGFSQMEIIALLADYLERLKASREREA